MVEIKVELGNAQALFRALAEKTENTRPAMVAIAETMLESVHENFEVGGRPAWRPLSEERIEQRSKTRVVNGVKYKKSWPGRILIEFGTQGGLLGTISRRATNDSAIVGSNSEYAAKHQFGFSETENVSGYTRVDGRQVKAHTRSVNFPARPFLVAQQEDINEAEAILLRHLLR